MGHAVCVVEYPKYGAMMYPEGRFHFMRRAFGFVLVLGFVLSGPLVMGCDC